MQEIANIMARTTVKQTDDMLLMVIKQRLGCDVLEITSLRGRLEMKIFPNGVEILCLDGVGLIELHPPQFEMVNEDNQVKIIAARNYRILTPDDQASKTI